MYFKKCFTFTIIIFFNCSFNIIDISDINPANIVYKNISMLDMKGGQNFFPKNTIKKELDGIKSEKLYKKPQFPSVKSDRVMPDIGIKKIIKDIHWDNQDFTDMWVFDVKGINEALKLSQLGIHVLEGKAEGKTSNDAFEFLGDVVKKDPFIQPNIKGLPIYKKDSWMPKKIDDIKINGLDDVLPTAIAPPFKEKDVEMDSSTDYFKDFLKPDKIIATDLVDLLP